MANHIDLEPVPFRNHDTLKETLDAAKSSRDAREEEEHEVTGSIVTSWSYSLDSVRLHLSGGKSLIVFAEQFGASWRVSNRPDKFLAQDVGKTLKLRFLSTPEQKPVLYDWTWHTILDSFVGKTVESIRETDGLVFLALNSMPDVTFSANRILDTEECRYLLFFFEED